MNDTTMKPVTRYQFCRAIDYGVKMMRKFEHDVECAFHFSTEFGDIAIMRKPGDQIVMGIIIDHRPVAIFDRVDKTNFWSQRGTSHYSYWSKLEIYDFALGFTNKNTKEVAK